MSRAVRALLLAVLAGSCGGGQRPPATSPVPPAGDVAQSESSVQQLYETGRYRELVQRVGAGDADAAAIWFAAQSQLRLGARDEAQRLFMRLAEDANPRWKTVAELALALLADDAATIRRGQPAAAALAGDPFAQFQLGLSYVRQNDFAAAAQAFDRASDADPRFAYAYYNAALAYDRLNRSDLMVIRFEQFERLAPGAPERPEVQSILRTVRGR